jgi:hypothetical protein
VKFFKKVCFYINEEDENTICTREGVVVRALPLVLNMSFWIIKLNDLFWRSMFLRSKGFTFVSIMLTCSLILLSSYS